MIINTTPTEIIHRKVTESFSVNSAQEVSVVCFALVMIRKRIAV